MAKHSILKIAIAGIAITSFFIASCSNSTFRSSKKEDAKKEQQPQPATAQSEPKKEPTPPVGQKPSTPGSEGSGAQGQTPSAPTATAQPAPSAAPANEPAPPRRQPEPTPQEERPASPPPSAMTPVNPNWFTPNEDGAIRAPILGYVNMDSKYQITNPGNRIVVENQEGQILAAGDVNLRAVMDGEHYDAQGEAFNRPFLLNIKPRYLSESVKSGSLSGNQKVVVSICQPTDQSLGYDQKIQCKDLNRYLGHSNGINTINRLGADAFIQNQNVAIKAIYNAPRHGSCGTSSLPCVAVAHPIMGFAFESNAFRNDNASPLVLDMNKNGRIDLESAFKKSPVQFDITADGQKVKLGWVSRGDALLALDVNNNNKIDNGSELFGEASANVQSAGESRFLNGFLALAQYDTVKDGVIDSKDKIFNSLKLWFDLNQNGISEKGELRTLAQAKVKALKLNYRGVGSIDAPHVVKGNVIKLEATYLTTSNAEYKMSDVWFEVRNSRSIAEIVKSSSKTH